MHALQSTGEGLAEPLSESLKEVQAQLSVVETETQELSSYTELALGQAEKLKKENAELRKAKEDAVVEGCADLLAVPQALPTQPRVCKGRLIKLREIWARKYLSAQLGFLKCRQLGQKKFETEKLATASTAYKKDLLQKTLVKRENEVQVAKDKLQAAERQIKSAFCSKLENLARDVGCK